MGFIEVVAIVLLILDIVGLVQVSWWAIVGGYAATYAVSLLVILIFMAIARK